MHCECKAHCLAEHPGHFASPVPVAAHPGRRGVPSGSRVWLFLLPQHKFKDKIIQEFQNGDHRAFTQAQGPVWREVAAGAGKHERSGGRIHSLVSTLQELTKKRVSLGPTDIRWCSPSTSPDSVCCFIFLLYSLHPSANIDRLTKLSEIHLLSRNLVCSRSLCHKGSPGNLNPLQHPTGTPPEPALPTLRPPTCSLRVTRVFDH